MIIAPRGALWVRREAIESITNKAKQFQFPK